MGNLTKTIEATNYLRLIFLNHCTVKQSKMSSVKPKDHAVNENNKDQDYGLLSIDFDESEMKYPIKSEERVEKERKLEVNGTVFYEKRMAHEKCDRADTKLLVISILRKIGDRTYKTSELFRNGESLEQKCNLKGDEKQDFESEWKENWKPADSKQDS